MLALQAGQLQQLFDIARQPLRFLPDRLQQIGLRNRRGSRPVRAASSPRQGSWKAACKSWESEASSAAAFLGGGAAALGLGAFGQGGRCSVVRLGPST